MLNSIPCDSYDVRLTDEDGDECVVEDVDICGGSEGWVITNAILLECEGFGTTDGYATRSCSSGSS